MSQANVELVRRVYAVGDLLTATAEQLDRLFGGDLDERFELRTPPDYPEGEGVFRGREGMEQLRATLRDSWREWRFETERFLDAGDQVVVFARLIAQGEASGAPIELETNHLWTIEAGRATSLQVYRNRSEALEAAGLQE